MCFAFQCSGAQPRLLSSRGIEVFHAPLSADLCPNSKLLAHSPKQCAETFNKASDQVSTRRTSHFLLVLFLYVYV